MTATASPTVQQDIVKHLGLDTCRSTGDDNNTDRCRSTGNDINNIDTSSVLSLSSRRDNLSYYAYDTHNDEDKRRLLLIILTQLTTSTCHNMNTTTNDNNDNRHDVGNTDNNKVSTKDLIKTMLQTTKSTNNNPTNKNNSTNNNSLRDKSKLPATIVYVSRRYESEALSEYIKSNGKYCCNTTFLFIYLFLH